MPSAPVSLALRRSSTHCSCCACAGLHEGLASLVEGGVPPRFLIIDDGWQNTDVDKRFRTPPTSRSMPKMKQVGALRL